jgi:catechol 2,3-dioxygenase-like lactoylglutathione lyase family enzyme
MTEGVPGIFRIIAPVSDLDAAADFYGRLLGTKGRMVGGGRCYFDCGPVILALLANSGAPIADYIYFSVADLEAVYARAGELGCLAGEQIHGNDSGQINTYPWGERSFYVRDPYGNGLCFVDENTLFTGRR